MRLATLAGALALGLGGCTAGVKYVLDEYTGVAPVPYEVAGQDTYKVYDKPTENKLMITPSVAAAAAMGATRGATWGAVDVRVPKPVMENAALAYLSSTGRTCRMTDGYMVVEPQWEFKYDCSAPAPAPSQAARKRR